MRPVDGGQHLGVAHLEVGGAVGLPEDAQPAPEAPQFARAATIHAEVLVGEELEGGHRHRGGGGGARRASPQYT